MTDELSQKLSIEYLFNELRDHHFYQPAINQESIIVDLGANLGDFSEQISKEFGCRCFAVEANPDNFNKIKDNPKLTKFNYAINDHDAPVDLHVGRHSEWHSLIKFNHTSQATVAVEGISLKSFLEKRHLSSVDLLKIDIEGAEIMMFNSTPDEVLKNISQITIEFHEFLKEFPCSEEIRAIKGRLKRLGFLCLQFSLLKNYDILFINVKKLKIPPLMLLYILLIKYVRMPIRNTLVKIKNPNIKYHLICPK